MTSSESQPRTRAGRDLPKNAAKVWRDNPAIVDRDPALLKLAIAIEAEAAAIPAQDSQDSRVGVERLAEAIDHAEREGGNYRDMKRSRWLAGRILARLPLTLLNVERLASEAEAADRLAAEEPQP